MKVRKRGGNIERGYMHIVNDKTEGRIGEGKRWCSTLIERRIKRQQSKKRKTWSSTRIEAVKFQDRKHESNKKAKKEWRSK